MAKYIKQEMPDLNKTGEKKTYYRLKTEGNITTKNLIDTICSHPGVGLSEGILAHALEEFADEMAVKLAEGYSVTLDGIGTFRAKVGVKEDAEAGATDGAESNRNARSLEVSGVNCKVSNDLVKDVRLRCELERAGERSINKSPYSLEERLGMLKDYLADAPHPYARVADYAKLTGMPKSTAAKELREIVADAANGITSRGQRSSKIYVIRQAAAE